MKLFIMIILLCFTLSAHAAIMGDVTIEGKVVSFNSKTVELSQRGKKISVKRSSIPKYYKIKLGSDVVSILKNSEVSKTIKSKKKKSY